MANINMEKLEREMALFQNTYPTEKIQIDNIWMAPQFKGGKSIWASWVREEKLHSFYVVWAWKVTAGRRQWLAIRLDSGHGRSIFIDLTTMAGQNKLKDLETTYGRFLYKQARALAWAQEAVKNINARAIVEAEGWTLKIFENSGREMVESDILYGGDPDEVSVDLKNKVVTVFYL